MQEDEGQLHCKQNKMKQDKKKAKQLNLSLISDHKRKEARVYL